MIRILKYGQVSEDEIFARAVSQVDVSATVREIIQVVRTQGDQALFDYTARFDPRAQVIFVAQAGRKFCLFSLTLQRYESFIAVHEYMTCFLLTNKHNLLRVATLQHI